MSASREKKARQGQGGDFMSPKQLKQREEARAAKRDTAIFTVCVAAFLVCVAAMGLWNSGVLKRSAKAASVNGTTYTAADMAYYYYNGRANALSLYSDSVSADSSLRDQTYTDGEQSWYDYVAANALTNLATAELTAKSARAAGFDGGAEAEATVREALASIEENAAKSGYSVSDYIKAIFGSLMTRKTFERNLRTAALADTYTSYLSSPDAYSEEELRAELDADPASYSRVSYEAAVFPSSSFAPESTETAENAETAETTETAENAENAETDAADDGSAAALAAAQDALARFQKGESLETAASELGGSYMNTSALYSAGSDMLTWLFDSSRKEGDADVVAYTYYGMPMGSVVVVYHGSELADFHAVDVRHILVADEATAQDLLTQFQAGEQTEDAFAALAKEHSTDTGSAENGGLYTGVYPGQMVAPFEAWCFDASRKPGDTGIVATDYGYHVMYFVGSDSHPYWQQQAAAKLSTPKLQAITENMETALLDGMKYIDP